VINMSQQDNLQGIPAQMARAIAFIWKEAELLDRKDYATWQTLWTDDGYYVVPIDQETTDFAATLNYAYDNAHMRKIRIERLTSGHAMSAVDAAATVRTVSRFVPVHLSDELVEITRRRCWWATSASSIPCSWPTSRTGCASRPRGRRSSRR
jgi:3-phenylpropionate/cinnamic acid dioxygenase small subunit